MVQRAHLYGDRNKIQTWMFTVTQNEVISLDVKLISNKFSTVNVINFILGMEKPKKLTLQNADKMLVKLRKLVAENPVELLIHHVQLLDQIFKILAIEYSQNTSKEDFNDANIIEHDENRQDVAFEVLLLMIDMFYAVFPQFKNLFTQYLEEHFY